MFSRGSSFTWSAPMPVVLEESRAVPRDHRTVDSDHGFAGPSRSLPRCPTSLSNAGGRLDQVKKRVSAQRGKMEGGVKQVSHDRYAKCPERLGLSRRIGRACWRFACGSDADVGTTIPHDLIAQRGRCRCGGSGGFGGSSCRTMIAARKARFLWYGRPVDDESASWPDKIMSPFRG